IDTVRTFSTEVRKMGMTIQQCAQGFRTAQMLKNFGIQDEFDGDIDKERQQEEFESNINEIEKPIRDHNNGDNSRHIQFTKKSKENSTKKKYNELTYFLDIIYKNCKNLGIRPTIIVKWIEDLFYCYSILDKEITFVNNNNRPDNINKEMDESSEQEESIAKEIPFVSNISYIIDQKKK